MTNIPDQVSLPLSMNKNWTFRRGVGLGINQAHMIGMWQLQPSRLSSLWSQCAMICELADERADFDSSELPTTPYELCQLLAKVIGALQRYAKIPVDRNIHVKFKAGSPPDAIEALIALPTFAPEATYITMQWLWRILNSAEVAIVKLEAEFYDLQQALRKYAISGENQWRIIQAALDEGLPVSYITSEFVLLGSGSNGRMFHSFITDKTSSIGVSLARNKYSTARILRSAGLPGAFNVLVNTADAAEREAIKMGFPVVVKPGNKDQGAGVESDLISASDVRSAFDNARAISDVVLVEKHQPGFTHRLTVIDGEVVRVTRHIAFGVYGNGVNSVEQLVDQLGAELSQRKRTHRSSKALLTIDAEADSLLRQRALTRSYVPANGEYVRLRRKDNISVGGVRITMDLMDIHPDNLDVAVRAARRLNLDIAGIDLITEDIGVSWLNSKVTICEVNAKPQVVARDKPEMYKIILRKMLGSRVRVPAKLYVVSENIRVKFLQDCRQNNPKVLISDASGVWCENRRTTHPFKNGFEAAKSVITDLSAVEIISILSPQEVFEFGLPLEKWDEIYIHMPETLSAPQHTNQGIGSLQEILAPHSLNKLKFIQVL